MTEYHQEDLIGKFGQKCIRCGNEDFFMTANGICQRCNYNNIFGKNISKEQMDYEDNKSHEEFLREVDEGRYIFKRRCSVCNEFIQIPAREDVDNKMSKFMNEHHDIHGSNCTIIIEDIRIDKIEIVREK